MEKHTNRTHDQQSEMGIEQKLISGTHEYFFILSWNKNRAIIETLDIQFENLKKMDFTPVKRKK